MACWALEEGGGNVKGILNVIKDDGVTYGIREANPHLSGFWVTLMHKERPGCAEPSVPQVVGVSPLPIIPSPTYSAACFICCVNTQEMVHKTPDIHSKTVPELSHLLSGR